MVIWLNGLSDGGKTALATELCRVLPGPVVADPEAIGDLLRSTLAGHDPRCRDYQDLPLWRQLTGPFAAGPALHTGGPVSAPMTVLEIAYAAEIFTRLRQAGDFHHLAAYTDPAAPQERIEAGWEFPGDAERSEAVRAYRRRRASDRYQAAADWMRADGHVIDTSALASGQILPIALAHLHLTSG